PRELRSRRTSSPRRSPDMERALWVLACAWVGRSEADDLVQETARIAWQRREQFDTDDNVAARLATIAWNLGANWRRKRRPGNPRAGSAARIGCEQTCGCGFAVRRRSCGAVG